MFQITILSKLDLFTILDSFETAYDTVVSLLFFTFHTKGKKVKCIESNILINWC